MIEKFKLRKYRKKYPTECNACHKKFEVLYHLFCGDTDLIQFCLGCKNGLIKAVNAKFKKPTNKFINLSDLK